MGARGPRLFAGPAAGLHPRSEGLLASPPTRSPPSGGEFGRLDAIDQRSVFKHVEEGGEFFELIHERAYRRLPRESQDPNVGKFGFSDLRAACQAGRVLICLALSSRPCSTDRLKSRGGSSIA